MNKKTIRIFTIIAICSTVLQIIPIVISYTHLIFGLTNLIEVLGLVSFHVLLFFVADDLKRHYKKDVWPIYLFSCYSIFMSFVFAKGTTQNNIQLMLLIIGILSIIFAVFMIRTVYRIFGIAYFVLAFFTAISYIIAPIYLDTDQMSFLGYISFLPVFYPLLLVYIVKTKAKQHQLEIESIGIEITDH